MKSVLLSCLILLPCLTAPAQAQAAPPSKTCQPCSLAVSPAGPVFSITLHQTSPAGKQDAAGELIVTRDSEEVQRLPLPEATELLRDPGSLRGLDLNFDGLLDLEVITSRGIANAYANYWLYKPAEKRFAPLGNYPVFTTDRARHILKSYERNGEAGLAYASKEYAFTGDKLQLMKSEVQEETAREGVFRLTIQKRLGGVLKVTSRTLVKAPAAPTKR